MDRSFLGALGLLGIAACGDALATFPRGGPAQPTPAATSAPTVDRYADAIAPPLLVPQAETPRPPLAVAGPPTGLGAPPPLRTGGDLTVSSPPKTAGKQRGGRLRTHVDGALSKGSPRVWVGIDVPAYVQLTVGPTELFLLDDVGPEGHFAFYRQPYDDAGCPVGSPTNCTYGAVLYGRTGEIVWKVALAKLLSRPDHLEIQDIRYAAGTLYFNEACQSYAREAAGRCSSLVAYEPAEKRVLWRTPPLTSNGVFAIASAYVVAGYGFTAEPDGLSVVRRRDGKIVTRVPLPSAHEDMELRAGGTLMVQHYFDKRILFRMDGFDGDHPTLVAVNRGGPEL